MRDIQKTYRFIQDYEDLCRRYGIVLARCQCGECDTLFPWDIESHEDLEEAIGDLIEWFLHNRYEISMSN